MSDRHFRHAICGDDSAEQAALCQQGFCLLARDAEVPDAIRAFLVTYLLTLMTHLSSCSIGACRREANIHELGWQPLARRRAPSYWLCF